jgi:lysophospholipase L1-like esterase
MVYFATTSLPSTGAERDLACGHFSEASITAPAPRDDHHSLERLAAINAAIKTEQNPILFLGDSITERWTPEIWRLNFAPRKGLNAGIDGDRTEHLLWRLDHGNLDGATPKLIVLLIGTNDLGHGLSPAIAAEGIRSDLIHLRYRLPNTHILLLGLTPRSDRFHDKVIAVNKLISTCGGRQVTYADIGDKLLDKHKKLSSSGILLDGVHFSAYGYDLLTKQLVPVIDNLLLGR